MSESVAVFVTVNELFSPMFRFVCAGKMGAELTSFTVTVNVFVALIGGTPLSVTTVVNVLVPGPCASFGVQVMIPFVDIDAFVGPTVRTYDNTFTGRSPSDAVFVTVINTSSLTVKFVCGGSVGAVLTSFTVTVNEFVALRAGVPLSVTTVVKVLVLGPCASVGVQVMMPFVEIAALVGATVNA